ncbi:ABC transporter ATP-binding protein [Brevibacillus fulvus]|uniref:Energy-coupling factor transport system ATP-binding protein n=1 Tax=Brevibacillus fulvus TaxID=1125967 RepID=A0A938XY46_9BACL|nr:ABC transporter ATP-binding protein [Brevibacillus fulvus]MBM7589064.1 energy-coupling factor transport system ATP-binding protein [Brevibacillus fulvus]
MVLCSCEQLTYQYPEAEQPALQNIQVKIEEGEFVLLLGASGSGKSTFLRALNGLVPRFYGGTISGNVMFAGKELHTLSQREVVRSLALLNQDPERQILLDTVERELVFAMENIGLPWTEMRSRLAEISHLFGLGDWLHRATYTLSGGEKQRLALASLLTLYPRVVLLDEPTSQLDPVHAEAVLHVLRRLNEEWGLTVLMSEHRVDRCFHLADRILFFDQGRVAYDGSPRGFIQLAADSVPEWQNYLPPITRHFLKPSGGQREHVPITVKEARAQSNTAEQREPAETASTAAQTRAPLLVLEHGTAGYEKGRDVLHQLSYTIGAGERIALLGENGAGKSTLAKVLAGAVPLRQGTLSWEGHAIHANQSLMHGRIGYLSQNPSDYFLYETVEQELTFALGNPGKADWTLAALLDVTGLSLYRDRHPHDLSGGERQRLALGILLAASPELLILDEPTRGLDQRQKDKLNHLLHQLPGVKSTVVITHDVEFALAYANRVTILYQGQIASDGSPDAVFQHSFSFMPQLYKWRRRPETS